MTQDEIIEMARQAGAAVGKPTPDGPNIVFTQCLNVYAFAKLVAAKEREACAKACENVYTGEEACGDWPTPEMCADAIRARGEA